MASTTLVDPVESKISKNTSSVIETKKKTNNSNEDVVNKTWTPLQYGFEASNNSPTHTNIFKLKTDFMKVFDLEENISKRPYETAKLRNVMNR